MKKQFIIILLSLLLVSCSHIERNTSTDTNTDTNTDTSTDTIADTNTEDNTKTNSSINNASSTAIAMDDYSDLQNDLVYHDYGTGVKLSKGSSIFFSQLNLNLKDETATIYVINLENGDLIKISEYQPLQDISYTTVSDGVYKLIAELSNGEIVDLTPEATIETSSTEDIPGGFIPLE